MSVLGMKSKILIQFILYSIKTIEWLQTIKRALVLIFKYLWEDYGGLQMKELWVENNRG